MSGATEVKQERFYTKEHEWVEIRGNEARVGITAFAVDQLGDVTLVSIDVKPGDKVEVGKVFGTIESVKTLSDLFAPISGTVKAVNDLLGDKPELVNDDPWDRGFMVTIDASNLSVDKAALLTASAYAKHLEEAAH